MGRGQATSDPPAATAQAPAASAPSLAVCAEPASDLSLLKAAARLAVDLNLPFAEKPPGPREAFEMLLVVTAERVELRVLQGDPQVRGGHPVFVDLAKVDGQSPAGASLKQPLAKALGLKKKSDPRPTVIDATGGYGEDAWLMALWGCRVLTVERHKVVATLLRDGLLRAGVAHPDMLPRVTAVNTDARHLLRRIARMESVLADRRSPDRPEVRQVVHDLPPEMRDFVQPEVVYLDPMFPGAAARKTAERKPLRVLRRLVGDDADAVELFRWALAATRKRVVVKRPLKAKPLDLAELPGFQAVKPTTAFKGKALRYDVYVV